MATTTGTIVFPDSAILKITETAGIVLDDVSADGFLCLLVQSGWTPDPAADVFISDITNEVSGFGYARDPMTNAALTEVSGALKFDADDAVFTATSDSIVARYWLLAYDNGELDTAREIICWGLLDDTPGDVTATNGNTITVQWAVGGIFTGSMTDA